MNEYALPSKAPGAISMTKIKNALKRRYPDLVPQLRNDRINGSLQGCTGFVTNPANGQVAYLSTQGVRGESIYRTAAHTKDFTGGRNHFCPPDELIERVAELIGA